MLVLINSESHLIDISNHTVIGHMGTPVDLSITPAEAYNLYRRLQEKSSELYDLATNYYDCHECGSFHHTTMRPCPDLLAREKEE